MLRLHSANIFDTPEITTARLPPILGVVWQQASKTSLEQNLSNNVYSDSAIKNNQPILEPENKQQTEVAGQMSPLKGIQPQNSITATEQFQESHACYEPVPFLNHSKS